MKIKFSTWEEDNLIFDCSEVAYIYTNEDYIELKNRKGYTIIGKITFIE